MGCKWRRGDSGAWGDPYLGDLEGYSAECETNTRIYSFCNNRHLFPWEERKNTLLQKVLLNEGLQNNWARNSRSIDLARGAFHTSKPFLQTHSKGTASFIWTEDLDNCRGHMTRSCIFLSFESSPITQRMRHLGDASNPKQRMVHFYYRGHPLLRSAMVTG